MAQERCYLLLDADITAYWYAASGEKVIRWDEETVSRDTTKELSEVCAEADAKIAEYRAYLDADEIVVCLSCPTDEGWRRAVLPTYKANRGPKPLHLAGVKDYLRTRYRTYEKPTLEADDVLGILSTHPKLLPGKRIVVSTDKDLKTIPGWLWNPNRESEPPRLIPEEEADYWHLYQTLIGDPTDNYKGCPGIGPKKAESIFRVQPVCWETVRRVYEGKGLPEADALLQARVARIARHTDYDFKRKEIKLWNPPTVTAR